MSRHRLVPSVLVPVAGLAIVLFAGCGKSADPPAAAAPAAGDSTKLAPSKLTTTVAAPGDEPTRPSGVVTAPPAAPAPSGDPERVLATVNGEPIRAGKVETAYQMNRGMLESRGRTITPEEAKSLQLTAFRMAVADELLNQAAVKAGIKISKQETQTAVKDLRARAGDEEQWKKFLADSDLTEALVESQVERNLRTDAYRKSLALSNTVTEAQAREFYDANKDMFKAPEQVHAQLILLACTEKDPPERREEAKKTAQEARTKAAAGGDFAALARQYSQDVSAQKGGDIGFVPRGVMFPNSEQIAFALKVGEVSPVFETPKGYNVIKVLERKPEAIRSFDEVKSPLMMDMGRLLQRNLFEQKIGELAAASKIVVLDPAFMPPAPGAPVAQVPGTR